MIAITGLRLKNWRNFRNVDVEIQPRTFVVGPNASGKSNLIDAFRFLHDLARPGGGLQRAVEERGGFSSVRSLFTHGPHSHVAIEVDVRVDSEQWTYAIGVEAAKDRLPVVHHERITLPDHKLRIRGARQEHRLEERKQTWLEQSARNADFEPLVLALRGLAYRHLVPQFLRTTRLSGDVNFESHGSRFIDRVVHTPKRVRDQRLRRINSALKGVLPFFSNLKATKDNLGVPHLELKLEHWRTTGAYQDELQLSDGTLRLIALLWEVQEAGAPLLLEEPEISLHEAVVRELPKLIARTALSRQVIITTHAFGMFNGRGIDPREVVLVRPGHGQQATESIVESGRDNAHIARAVENELQLGKELEAETRAPDPTQLLLALEERA